MTCPNGCDGCHEAITLERLRADALAQELFKVQERLGDATRRMRDMEMSLARMMIERDKNK